jgi:hypothetical protein
LKLLLRAFVDKPVILKAGKTLEKNTMPQEAGGRFRIFRTGADLQTGFPGPRKGEGGGDGDILVISKAPVR